MHWYENDVKELEQRLRAAPPPQHAVVFYGSSTIRMWTSLAQDFPELPVVNAGFGGSTLQACVHFFDRLITPLHPGALVLYAGDNDLGDGSAPEQFAESFSSLIQRLELHCGNIPLRFISIKPSLARWHLAGTICKANALARERVGQYPQGGYIDVYHPMLGPDGRPRPELFLGDGLHLSGAGYRLWRDVLREALREHPLAIQR